VLNSLKKPDKQSPKGPPLRVDSTLHLAWGLTLFLSHDKNQNTLAEKLQSTLLASFSSDAANKLDDNDLRYVQNLIAVVSAYLRRMGFEKEVYDRYLDAEKTKLERITEYWKNVGDMTSFSTESVIIRITSFLGIGSSGDFFVKWLGSIKRGAEQASSAQSAGNDSESIVNGSVAIVNGTQSVLPVFSQADIGVILIFGSVGLLTTIAFLKWFGFLRVEKARKETLERQNIYWKDKARKEYKGCLTHLYDDIKKLVSFYYPKYTEPIFVGGGAPNQGNEVHKVIEEILPAKNVYTLPTEENTMRYFAYGSNMNPDRMRERKVNSLRGEHAILSNYSLQFNKIASANPMEGKANIISNAKDFVEGVLYDIEFSDIEKLDLVEGYPIHYYRTAVPVKLDDGTEVEAFTYIAQPNMVRDGLKPTKKYLNHLLAAKDILSKDYYQKLESWPTLD